MEKEFLQHILPLLDCPNFRGLNFKLKTDSTMSDAKVHCFDKDYDKNIFLSLSQSEGIGTNKREFLSEEGGIYLSILFNHEDYDPSELSVRLPAGIYFAVKKICGEDSGIKWVNDIILNGKKIAGILVNSAYMGKTHAYTIVGIGFNVNQSSFGKFDNIAGSLYTQTRNNYPLPEAAAIILNSIHEALYDLPISDIMQIYRLHSTVIGRNAKYLDGENIRTCVIKNISPGGHLIAESDGKIFKIISRSEIAEFL